MNYFLRKAFRIIAVAIVFGVPAWAQESGSLAESPDDVLSHLIRVGSEVQTMEASIERDEVNGLLDTHLLSSGRIYFEARGADSRIRMNLTEPSPQELLVADGRAQLFNPKTLQFDEHDLGERRDVAEYLVVGFGPGNAELETNFEIAFEGEEEVDGRRVSVLFLTPHSAEVRRRVNSIRLWIDQQRWLPVQQRLNTPSGNHVIVTYSDVRINAELPEGTFELDLPDGVRR